MNENNKSFYPSDMFEFIHHLEYGCRDLKWLIEEYVKKPSAHGTSTFNGSNVLCENEINP
jgi:hypothetical protein